MIFRRPFRWILLVCLVVLCAGAESARANSLQPIHVPPGLLFSISVSGTQVQLTIPADFFAPGSDPFNGTVNLTGIPLGGPNQPLGPLNLGPVTWQGGMFTLVQVPANNAPQADTVIQRKAPAVLPGPPSTDQIPIEIVALNLVSTQPIVVTMNGGQNPTPWNVTTFLNPQVPQQPGQLILNQTSPNGGTFSATLPVTPVFIFTNPQQTTQGLFLPGPTDILTARGNFVAIPEPATLALLGTGLVSLALRRRRKL